MFSLQTLIQHLSLDHHIRCKQGPLLLGIFHTYVYCGQSNSWFFRYSNWFYWQHFFLAKHCLLTLVTSYEHVHKHLTDIRDKLCNVGPTCLLPSSSSMLQIWDSPIRLPCFSLVPWELLYRPYHFVIFVPHDSSEISHPSDPWRYTADTRKRPLCRISVSSER